jgi:hypothetical protein
MLSIKVLNGIRPSPHVMPQSTYRSEKAEIMIDRTAFYRSRSTSDEAKRFIASGQIDRSPRI